MNTNAENYGIESKISVKSGDLAAKGKGTVAITHTPDGRFWVRMSLPDEAGTPKPLDLTTIDRVELVETKTGWFEKGQWVKPVVATVGGVIGVPILFVELFPATTAGTLFWGATSLGTTYAAGVYTGSKLTRLARFVVTTHDDQHVVLKGPVSVFHFMNGVYAAPNIQLDEDEPETSPAPSEEPAENSAPSEEPAENSAPSEEPAENSAPSEEPAENSAPSEEPAPATA
jgi:hypothetical protein